MRTKWVTGIVLGILLIYISIFGIEGFGLSFLNGDLMKEDFSTANGWVGAVITNPVGQLYLVSSGQRNYAEKTIALPSQFTIEMRLKIDRWGTSTRGGAGEFFYQISTSQYTHIFSINQNDVLLVGVGASPVAVSTDTNWHVWIITVDGVNHKTEVYVDDLKVATFTSMYAVLSSLRDVELCVMSSSGTVEVHVDYWYVDAGIKPPGNLPPSETGTLKVYASYDGNYVATSITVSGPESHSGTTSSSGSPLSFVVTPGTYTVTGTYSGITKTESGTVVTGGETPVTLNFGGITPPPPNPTDIWAMIKAWFKTAAVKQLMLYGGAGLAGISTIIFIIPEKRRSRPAPYPYY